jgi:hypothetical protein
MKPSITPISLTSFFSELDRTGNRMSKLSLIVFVITATLISSQQSSGQSTRPLAAADMSKSDLDQETRAAEWVAALKLNDPARESRLTRVIATHLKAVRDWHNDHPYSIVPEGINPLSGKELSTQDRQVIADSAMPKTVHQSLMAGLRNDLPPEQVEAILDKYTEGKVAFTMGGYHAIVPDLTPEEEATILGFLKQAREQAVDFKGSKLISAIFEIYKTKSEQYLNSKGRDWHALYKAYTDAAKARKAATAPAVQ